MFNERGGDELVSLIIGFNVRDGIVVAADRCTTHRKNGVTSHNFDSRKIAVLDDRLVVLHCGDYFVRFFARLNEKSLAIESPYGNIETETPKERRNSS